MKSILITGGAGFIGVNTARHFHERGWAVTILDNLLRRCASENLDWLRRQQQVRFEVPTSAISLPWIVDELRPNAVVHLTAQVAVTTSVANPREDFEHNALSTLNVLDAIRTKSP
jgi:CDP-paratose 2-epimerase